MGRCGRCACVARLGVGPTAILARGGASHGGLQSRLHKHGGKGCADSATPQVSRLFTVVQVVGFLRPGLFGEMPHSGVHGPARLTPGAVYIRELAPLGTGYVGGLVIAGPTVGSGNACELFYSVRVILCLLHSE